jgi:hypothetical protein
MKGSAMSGKYTGLKNMAEPMQKPAIHKDLLFPKM